MTLAQFADLSEVIGAFGVIIGLIFVGIQLRQNTKQMQRAEANTAMAQASALRHLLLENREVAQLLVSGMSGVPLDPIDELRLNTVFSEIAYIATNIWDRSRHRLDAPDELERLAPVLAMPLSSDRGRAWWARMRGTLNPDFVQAFEALVPVLRPPAAPLPTPSATAPQGPTSAVAPPADAG